MMLMRYVFLAVALLYASGHYTLVLISPSDTGCSTAKLLVVVQVALPQDPLLEHYCSFRYVARFRSVG